MSTVADLPSGSPVVDWNRLIACALDGVGVRSVFQPIVDLQRCAVVGYEALTRFDLPGAPRVGPDTWFAQAERLGVGAELDARAIRMALGHRADLPANCFLTVNIDPAHLLEPSIQELFAAQPSLDGLVIEFTEHREWKWSELEPAVDVLRDNGVIIAIDDAGVGYSGLHQILDVRPSIVKLDRSLIAGIDRDEARAAVVEMMGSFASRVDAWLLAEGVETGAEARRLFDLGVPLVQGYYFARPDAPWSGLTEDATRHLGGLVRDLGPSIGLEPLMERVAPLRSGVTAAVERIGSEAWSPVIDQHGRPAGVVGHDAAFSGELLTPVVANVHSDPREVAHRVSTAPLDPRIPIVVIDDLGKYRGIVTLRRLLRHLADSEA